MKKPKAKARPNKEASVKAKKAFAIMVGNGGRVGPAMVEAGYSPNTAITPSKLTRSSGWQALMDEYMPEKVLAEKHRELLNASALGHMVFPVEVTEEAITELLATVNCVPKKFQHGEMQTHVWFWAADNRARKDGLDMAYKLRGSFAPQKIDADLRFEDVTLNEEDTKLLNRAIEYAIPKNHPSARNPGADKKKN